MIKTFILPRLHYAPLGDIISQTHQQWTSFSNDDRMYIIIKGVTYKRLRNTQTSTFLPTCEVVECKIPADIYTQRDNPIVYGFGTVEVPTRPVNSTMPLWDMYIQAPT